MGLFASILPTGCRVAREYWIRFQSRPDVANIAVKEDNQVEMFKNRKASSLAKRARAFLTLHKNSVSRTVRSERVRVQTAGIVGTPVLSKERIPIFFIVGYQKSGTTWLMTMLDSHPEILCQGEGRPFGRNFRQEHLKQKKMSYPPTSLYNAIMSAEDLRYWVERSVWSKDDNTSEHLSNLTRLSIEYFLTHRLQETGKRLVGDKTVLLSAEIVKEISEIYPEARVIHIIRDGRDVAISAMHHRWNQAEDRGGSSKTTSDQRAKRDAYRKDPQDFLKTGEGIFSEGWLEKSAARWNARVSKTANDGPALLGANYVEVKYEDLLENPGGELKRLLEFLGADASEQATRDCVDAASFERLAGGRDRGQEAASFFRKGIAGDWSNVFTERDKQDFKAVAGDLLVKLGYEEDNNW